MSLKGRVAWQRSQSFTSSPSPSSGWGASFSVGDWRQEKWAERRERRKLKKLEAKEAVEEEVLAWGTLGEEGCGRGGEQ